MALLCASSDITKSCRKPNLIFNSRTGHHTTILPNGFTEPFGSISFCTDFGPGLYLVFILNLWSLSREFGFFAALLFFFVKDKCVGDIQLDRIAEYVGNEAQMMNDGLSRKRSARAFTCAVDKVVDKLLNVPARNLVEPQMPNCGINPCCMLFHSLKRGIAQIDFCVFIKRSNTFFNS